MALVVKSLPVNAGDTRDVGSIPGVERSLGVGNGNPLQHSCLKSFTDRGALQAMVHGIAKSCTRLSTHAGAVISYISATAKHFIIYIPGVIFKYLTTSTG